MPQTTDIVLDSAGYMIQPSSPARGDATTGYKRLQDGMAEGRTQRTAISDFFGGQRRASQLERDKFGDSLNIGPALGGQGVQPWAYSIGIQTAALNGRTPNAAVRIPHVIVRDRVYIAIGQHLIGLVIAQPGGAVASTLINTFPNPITDITIFASNGLLVAFGSAADIIFWNLNTGTGTTYSAGDRGHRIENWAGFGIWTDARVGSIPTIIRMAKGLGTGVEFRNVAYDCIGFATVGAELLLITKQALFTFSGRVRDILVNNPAWTPGGSVPQQVPGQEWIGEFTPFFQQGVYLEENDFTFITGYGGRTIAWLAGGVHELVPTGERAGWRSTGLTGLRCFGGTVAAGYVVVSIESENNRNEIWAYDGNGWWRIYSVPMPASGLDGVLCWPFPAGGAGATPASANRSVGFFAHASTNITYFRLTDAPQLEAYSYAPSAQFVTPLIDASERDKPKAWRKIGAVFASPEQFGNLASTDTVGVALEYSIDGGITWVTAQDRWPITGNTLQNMNFELSANLSGVVSHFILIRVRWSSVSDWAPILTGVWVEHEILDSPARRRKWQLKIHARDQEIDRDGVMLTRTGRQLIAELWSAWETDTPLPFRDIDYDDHPVERTVRIVGIAEHTAQPSDSNRWGDSLITLNLVEV